jgi:transcriptional regulator with GAF, ATPase, and Fis domain
LLLVLDPGPVWTREHEVAAQVLIEPLAVALENASRLHESARVREALEAEREALLTRLGRQEISEVVVGELGGLSSVMERVEQVAPTDAPVLILGETGAGKEVVARTIHENSKRTAGPMVRINCGAIPPELVDSELFGHEPGSFTGAVARRKGWFERADGGTLFLDEVGELPLAAQIRLLRVLQDGIIDRVGAQKSITVDVRIVAATHRDLEEMVRGGTFRQDLWYRISVFPIRLPPLRERLEDIPALAAHFARRAGKRLGGMPLPLTAEDISMLVSYHWPGNVRELASVIERATILGNSQRLQIAAALGVSKHAAPAPVAARAPLPVHSATAHGAPAHPAPRDAEDAGSTLNAAMVGHIETALAKSRGRIDGPFGAATALGINPHTLRARMRKLGVDWKKFRG